MLSAVTRYVPLWRFKRCLHMRDLPVPRAVRELQRLHRCAPPRPPSPNLTAPYSPTLAPRPQAQGRRTRAREGAEAWPRLVASVDMRSRTRGQRERGGGEQRRGEGLEGGEGGGHTTGEQGRRRRRHGKRKHMNLSYINRTLSCHKVAYNSKSGI